uniref:phosphoinositide 3-kinase regulatory subunit 6 n=1 Tax=Monopterus albus TaxID=43700 RepID=UPI0009B2EC42|nr:phosphoinositide 3-kinase regulatory subunit 6-like [Monopterus albus]
MVDPTAVESSLHNDIQALLREMNSESASQKGLLRWTLEKKVETNPSCSIPLIQALVRELEEKLNRANKIGKAQPCVHIIPMLHTLYYVVIQSGSTIPTSLYQKVYECLIKLLILPLPQSTVALRTLRSIKMEMTTPGSLYERRVTAEQNLKNEHFPLQEKVFVLADPAVFSAPLEVTVRTHLEVSNLLRDTATVEKNLVLRVLQTGLGVACQSAKLAQALEASEDHMVEKYFQEVVLAVEQSVKHGAAGSAAYMNRLQHMQRDILAASKEEMTTAAQGSVCSTALPFPEISFLLWKEDDDLWNLLANITLRSNSGVKEEKKSKRDLGQSEDRGVNMKYSDNTGKPPAKTHSKVFARKNAFRNMQPAQKLSLMKEKIDVYAGSSPVLKQDRKHHTARVLVLGDDRVLGRLGRAYHSIRKRESKHLILTKKLDLQFYYIPVIDEEPSLSSPSFSRIFENCDNTLAALLRRLDPWYDSNVSSLGATISKLPALSYDHSAPSEQSLYLLDNLCYYLRCGTQPVKLPLYSVKMMLSSGDMVEEVFVSDLKAHIPDFRHLKEKLSQKETSTRIWRKPRVEGPVISVTYTETSICKREVVKGVAVKTCFVVVTSQPAAATGGEDYLTVSFDSVSPVCNREIRTQNIVLVMLEHWTLSVHLDQDSRKTYTDVQRVEISPCLDPGCFFSSTEHELPLIKYMDKVLSLPINTFTGATL